MFDNLSEAEIEIIKKRAEECPHLTPQQAQETSFMDIFIERCVESIRREEDARFLESFDGVI